MNDVNGSVGALIRAIALGIEDGGELLTREEQVMALRSLADASDSTDEAVEWARSTLGEVQELSSLAKGLG